MSKKIENKWAQLGIYIAITIIVGFILFPLLDYIYCAITKSTFVYSIHEHIQRPIELGSILGLISWAVQHEHHRMD